MERMKKRILSIFLVMALVLSLLPGAALAAKSSRTGTIIDVTDYGADPTGIKESSTAVIAALAAAAELPAGTEKTIYFPKGEYHFYADYSQVRELYVSNTVGTDRKHKNKHLGILVEDMENVTIDGGGSQFIYHGDITSFATIRSKNVKFTNFDMDHASPSVVDVTVESHVAGENAAILYVPPCYTYSISGTTITWKGESGPVTGAPYWQGNNGLGYCQAFDTIDGTTARGRGNPFDGVSSIQNLGNDRLKVTYNAADKVPVLGRSYQMRNTTRTTPGTFFWESDGVEVKDVNIQFLHGFGMVGQLSKNITLDGVHFETRPGSGRTSAGFADFVQMSSVGGKVTIKNCDFSNPHDDPINIHGTFLTVAGVSEDNKTFTLKYRHNETGGFPQYYVGDTVDFSVKGSMAPVAGSERTVTAVVQPGEDGNDLNTTIITLNEPVTGITGDNNSYVVENVTYTPEVLIENCRFVETPTRGVLVTTRRPVVIQNNYFDRMGMASIFISCDASSWYESGRTEDVLIQNNVFNYSASAAILVEPTGNGSAGNRVHKNMRIINNTFNMVGNQNAVNARSVDGLTIEGNLIQRYTPNVSMTLTAASQSVNAGGSQATTLTANGASFGTQLYHLRACENVTIKNNTYDDGLNLGASLADGTAASNVTVTGEALTVGGGNQQSAVGAVSYFSSDPAVATVDASGVVTGVKAGTAEIYAYRMAGARGFESNHLTFTVSGTAPTAPAKIEVTGADTVAVDGSVNLTASVSGVTWAVKPLTTGAAATITQSGVLSATAPGVVEVTASLGGVTGSRIVTVSKPVGGLNEAWTVEEEVSGNWSLNEAAGTATIKTESGGDWSTGPGGHNYFLTTAPTGNFEAVVKLHNKICGNGNCWCESGLILYADHNNYVSVVRKNAGGSPKLAVNSEYGGSAGEGSPINDISDTAIYFKLTKSGTSYSGYYSTNGTDWTLIRTETNAVSDYKVGFFSINAGGGHNNVASTFSDFKLDGTAVPLVSTNVAPTATNVTVARDGNAMKVTYTYADADSDAETGTVIAWYVSAAADGHYTRVENASGTTLTVTEDVSEKYVKAVVVPVDSKGRPGTPVTSNSAQAPAQAVVQTDATLRSLSVDALTLSPAFDPATTAYTVSVPASAGSVTVAAQPSQKNATVSGTGTKTLTGETTAATVTVTAPDNTTTKTYTVTIVRPKSNNAALSALTATAGSGTGITFDPATRFYQVIAAQGAENLAFSLTKADSGATVKVRFNGKEKGNYTSNMSLPLVAGLNNLELRVTAADGVSTALYRVAVMKPAANDAELTALTVNGENVTVGDGADLGLIQVTGNTATLNATASNGATVSLGVDGKAVENNASVTLTKTLSMVTIRVVAEDGATQNVYTLVLSKVDPGNADLYLLKLEGMTLSPAFDKDTLSYTATFTDQQGVSALTAAATQPGADVTCETVSVYETAKGRVARDCTFFRDAEKNFVKITVTSPNGATTKEYIVNVTYQPVVYLSDLQWTSHSSGWSSGWPNPGRDIGVQNNPMILWNESSSWEAFEKGLGTHANSNTVFDISSYGFTNFTAKVGPNQNSGSPHISFEVQGDGETLWQSDGEITHSDPYQTIDINVTDVSTFKIIDNQSDSNGSAHATWADAKFSGGDIGPALAETVITPVALTLDKDEATIYTNAGADHTVKLTADVKPVGAGSVSWSSSAPTVASVNENGEVTALNVGAATITASVGGKSVSCDVTVKSKLGGSVAIVQSTPKFDDTLTVNLSGVTPEGARDSLVYQWFRGNSAISGAAGSGSTYRVVKADLGQTIKVKVSAPDESLYEGEFASEPTAAVGKKAGPAAPTGLQADGENGKITGLTAGTAYEIQKDNGTWEDATLTGTEITDLGPGLYKIRVKVEDADVQELGAASSGLVLLAPGVEAYAVSVDSDITGGTVTVSKSLAEENDEITVTATPAAGYELKSLTVTKDSDGSEVAVNADGVFIMPDEDVTVTAEFEAVSYTIHHDLKYIECEMHNEDHTIRHGETRTMTLTAADGYEMPETAGATGIQVTEDDDDTWHNFTYTRSPDKKTATLVIDGTDVVSDLTVSGEGVAIVYRISHNLTDLNCDLGDEAAHKVGYKEALSITLSGATAAFEPPAAKEDITITMGGAAFHDFTYEDGTITIAAGKITGDLVITAAGVKQPIAMKGVGILGSFKVGSELTARVLPVNATVTYQWYRVDGETATAISGATGDKYTLTDDDLGKQIRVNATGTGDYSGTVSSRITAIVMEADAETVDVTGMTLNRTTLTLAIGGTFQLVPTITPADATDQWVYWSSDDESVATVSRSGLVTAIAEGTANIIATTADGPFTVTCAVTVTKATTPDKPSTSRPSTTPTTETKEDGTKVTTETKPDGTKVETVEEPDGTKSVTETKPDGSTVATVEEPDGTKAVTETKPDGSKTATVEQPDGTKSETVVTAEGEATVTVTDPEGEVLAEVSIPAEIPEPETKFEDIDQTPWAEEAINKVAGLELVKGIGGNKYDPVTPMTRGALATVLHRLSNGKTDYEVAFKDVKENTYYTEGVAWAAKVNVVKGVSEDIFAPDEIITREQLAVMLARYAKLIGMNTKADAKALDAFADGEKTGAWAVDGMAWCVEKGILKGKGQGGLDPTAEVSRAEVAVMLDRFIALIK